MMEWMNVRLGITLPSPAQVWTLLESRTAQRAWAQILAGAAELVLGAFGEL